MPGRPYILAETNWKAVRELRTEVAILPWGATEAHNYHLPYGTDTFESDHFAAEAARRAWEAGIKVVVLPAIPFGVQTGQIDIPLCINMNPSTQFAILSDVATSLAGNGVRKLVVLNGHGGNDFRQMIRELQPRVNIFLCTVSWFKIVDQRAFFTKPDDHGGEMETSVMQHIAGEFVLPLSEAGDGRERKPKIAAMREGWAWAPRRWTQVSTDTGVGDPRVATAEKGAKYIAAVAEKLGQFVVDLANADANDLYE